MTVPKKVILWLVTWQLSCGDDPGANALGLANILNAVGIALPLLEFPDWCDIA